jgi:DNA-binding Lrp family transcriptional regulator
MLLVVAMDKALVLLTLEPTSERDVLNKLRKLKGVTEAHFLYGPYDAYVIIEGKSSSDLQALVIDRIRHIEGINSTMTCFIAD